MAASEPDAAAVQTVTAFLYTPEASSQRERSQW